MPIVARYSTQNARFTPGFGDQIREDYVGWDADELIFPGISTCTGVAAATAAGRLAGMHLTIATPGAAVDALIARAIEYLQGPPALILLFGALAHPAAQDSETNPTGGWKLEPRFHWPRQIATFRAALNAPGAETRLRAQHGVGADFDYRVVSEDGGACALSCRANGGDGDWTDVSTIRMA